MIDDTATVEVLVDVRAERARQNEKWGEQNHDTFVWLAILGEEVGEVSEAALNRVFGPIALDDPEFDLKILAKNLHVEDELIQVAAVAVNIVESLRRRRNA